MGIGDLRVSCGPGIGMLAVDCLGHVGFRVWPPWMRLVLVHPMDAQGDVNLGRF